jgi:hypothetical protein
MLNRPARVLTLVVALSWVLCGTLVSAQAVPAVDTERLMRDLSVLAHDSMSGRSSGTTGALKARAFLVSALEEAGLVSPEASPLRAFSWPGGRGVNVIAEVPGRSGPEGDVVVLTAHYDHLGVRDGVVYNGSDDNASGTVALLEIGRQLRSEPLAHNAILAFVDAEEVGLNGSRALIADPPVPLHRIALNVNLDMVSRTDGVLWAGGAYHTPELRPVLEDVAKRAPLTLRLGHDRPGAPEGADWTEASDHASFHRAGIPWVYFGVDDHVDYHEPTDDVDRIDPQELTEAVQTILMGLRALDSALPLEKTNAR